MWRTRKAENARNAWLLVHFMARGRRPRRLLRVKWAPVVWPSSCQHFTVQLRVSLFARNPPKSEESWWEGFNVTAVMERRDLIVWRVQARLRTRSAYSLRLHLCCTSLQLPLAFERPKVYPDFVIPR
jgi:hypothetical protein